MATSLVSALAQDNLQPTFKNIPTSSRVAPIDLSIRCLPLNVPVGKMFDLFEGFDAAIDACRSPYGLADAIGMMTAIAGAKGRSAGFEKAIYVIQAGDEDISKVGVSADPLKRRQELQGAHYLPLTIYGVVFCPTRKSVTIEQSVLQAAAEGGTRLMGEWVSASPDTVLRKVLEIARDGDFPVCDGKTYLANMIARTRALARHNTKHGISYRANR